MRTERDLPRREHELLCILEKALVAQCIALPAAGALGEISQAHQMAEPAPAIADRNALLQKSDWITMDYATKQRCPSNRLHSNRLLLIQHD